MLNTKFLKLSVLLFVLCSIFIVVTVESIQPWPANDPLKVKSGAAPLRIIDRNGELLGFRSPDYVYGNESAALNLHQQKPYHEIPPLLLRAFVYAEDQRFWSHQGVDWLARANAALNNLLELRVVRGASTISEQVVRILRPRPRTLWSRWLEGIEATALENQSDKVSILEFYVNQVPFAGNTRGVEQAANYYFGRSLSTLNVKELLALAVFVRAPSFLHPKNGIKAIDLRLSILAERMFVGGALSQKEYDSVKSARITLTKSKSSKRIAHLLNYVAENWNGDGRTISTSIDFSVQVKLQNILESRLKNLQQLNVQNGAALVVDHRTNQIISWVVAGDSQKESRGSAYDAVLQPRQPGSTLKPFIYAMALEQGYTAALKIDDTPLNEAIGQGMHQYQNYSQKFYGPISLREALGNSLNIPAVRMLQKIGAANVMRRFKQLGFSLLDQQINLYGDGLALGNGAVSLFELVQAYTALARQGNWSPLKITIDQLPESSVGYGASEQVFDPAAASLIGNILADPYAREKEFGRSSVLNQPVQTAVKTGTSSNYHDAWVVGFNDTYTVGVWMGNMDYSVMDGVTGSTGPAYVLRTILAELNRYRKTAPLPVNDRLVKKNVCYHSGQIKTYADQCRAYQEFFIDGFSQPSISEAQFRISQPTAFLNIARDPRVPDELEVFRFKIKATSEVKSVRWLLNDQELGQSQQLWWDWPLEVGEHSLQALLLLENGTLVETPARVFTVH